MTFKLLHLPAHPIKWYMLFPFILLSRNTLLWWCFILKHFEIFKCKVYQQFINKNKIFWKFYVQKISVSCLHSFYPSDLTFPIVGDLVGPSCAHKKGKQSWTSTIWTILFCLLCLLCLFKNINNKFVYTILVVLILFIPWAWN